MQLDRIRWAADARLREAGDKVLLLLFAIEADASGVAAIDWRVLHARSALEDEDVLAHLRGLQRDGWLTIVEADVNRDRVTVRFTP